MDFIRWLQLRLAAHGFDPGPADGIFGARTRHALAAFQRSRKLAVSGQADNATVAALRLEKEGGGQKLKTVPTETMPPWMAELHRRMGLHETRDNRTLSEWLRFGKFLGDPAKLPWCGDAIETAFARTLPDEPLPGNPFWAQGWKDFGVDAGGPEVGAVGVIRWNASSGHVGLVAEAKGSRIVMLGGNQSNMIRLSAFDRNVFIGFRWPRSFPKKDYPPLAGTAEAGSSAGTR